MTVTIKDFEDKRTITRKTFGITTGVIIVPKDVAKRQNRVNNLIKQNFGETKGAK